MSAEAVLSAIDSRAVLVAGIVVVGLVSMVLVALVGHLVMKPVRKTRVGQWATLRADAHMDAYAARKSTKAEAA